MKAATATPRPWAFHGGAIIEAATGVRVGDIGYLGPEVARANARLVLLAVNHHDALLAAAKTVLAEADKVNAVVARRGLGLSEPPAIVALRSAVEAVEAT